MAIKCAMDFGKKQELEQRMKTRLIQVRQQAKDFARKMRQSITAESMDQQNRILENKKKKLIEDKKEKLLQLEKEYHTCLQNVGEGHMNALVQPNTEHIRKIDAIRKASEASKRGENARKKHLELEALRCHLKEAPIMRKKQIHAMENLRSYYISSLPKSKMNHIILPASNKKPCRKTNISEERPINLQIDCQAHDVLLPKIYYSEKPHDSNKDPECSTEENIKDREGNSPRGLTNSENCGNSKHIVQDKPKCCACVHGVCCCHNFLSETRRRRRYSDSLCSSERSPLPETLHTPTANRTRFRSRSCSPRGVRTLNYTDVGNLYESTQPSLVNVIYHQTKPTEMKEEDVKRLTEKGSLDNGVKSRRDELNKNTEERGAKALNREQLKKDFQQLMSDLGNISRNRLLLKRKKNVKSVHQKEREIVSKHEHKQEKLSEAFENLFDLGRTSLDKNNVCSRLNLEADKNWSPPSLNLAAYSNYNPAITTDIQDCNSPNQNNYIKDRLPCHTIDQYPRERSNNQSSIRTEDERNLIDQQMSSERSLSPPNIGTGSQSPCSSRPASKPRDVSPKRQSGDVIVRAQVEGRKRHKKKCNRNIRRHPAPEDSSTSYYSPPEHLTPSQKRLFDALIIQVNKKEISEDLKAYIETLLSMSRESINKLNVETSTTLINSDSESDRSLEERKLEEDMLYLSALTEKYADKVNDLVDMFDRIDSPECPDRYMEPPHVLQSQTKIAGPLSHCPPAPTPSPRCHLGSHINSERRYYQQIDERQTKLKQKMPLTQSNRDSSLVKCGQSFGVVPCVEYSSDPVDSNDHENHPIPPNKPTFPPDHSSGNTTQYPCSSPPVSPKQSFHRPNQSPAMLLCSPGTSGSKCAVSSSTFKAKDIHSLSGLPSTILPHPRDVFRQGQDASAPGPPSGNNLNDSMGWLFEVNGMPPLPPPSSDLDPNQLARAYRREHMPHEDTIRTPNSSFDMEMFLDEAEARIKAIAKTTENKMTSKDFIGANSGDSSSSGFNSAIEKSALSQTVNDNQTDSIKRHSKQINDDQYKAVLEMLQEGGQNIIEFFKDQMKTYQGQPDISVGHGFNFDEVENPIVTRPSTLDSHR